MEHTSRHTWVPYVAAAAGAVLALKAVLVMATDGAPSATAVLYLGGLLLALVAAVGAGLRQRGLARGLGVGLASTVLLLLWIIGLGDAVKPVIGVVSDSEVVQAEVPILLAGLVLLALAWRARNRDLDVGVDAQLAAA